MPDVKPGVERRRRRHGGKQAIRIMVEVKYLENAAGNPSQAAPMDGAQVRVTSPPPTCNEFIGITNSSGAAEFRLGTHFVEGTWTIYVAGSAGSTDPKQFYESRRYVTLEPTAPNRRYVAKFLITPTNL